MFVIRLSPKDMIKNPTNWQIIKTSVGKLSGKDAPMAANRLGPPLGHVTSSGALMIEFFGHKRCYPGMDIYKRLIMLSHI